MDKYYYQDKYPDEHRKWAVGQENGSITGDFAPWLIEQLQAKFDALQWKRVSEGLPKEKDEIVLWKCFDKKAECDYGNIQMGTVNEGYADLELGWHFTHWMPIPTLPDEQEAKDE